MLSCAHRWPAICAAIPRFMLWPTAGQHSGPSEYGILRALRIKVIPKKVNGLTRPFWLFKMAEKILTSLSGLVINKTVLRGTSTAGWLTKGTLRKVLPGMCFQVDQGPGTQISYLWRSLTVVDEPPSPAETLIEIVVDSMTLSIPSGPLSGPPPPPYFPEPPQLRRTDSGADYGFPGYPDCAFWTALGIPTFFVVPNCQFTGACIPAEPAAMRALLLEVQPKAIEDGGLYLETWARQMAEVERLFLISRQ